MGGGLAPGPESYIYIYIIIRGVSQQVHKWEEAKFMHPDKYMLCCVLYAQQGRGPWENDVKRSEKKRKGERGKGGGKKKRGRKRKKERTRKEGGEMEAAAGL